MFNLFTFIKADGGVKITQFAHLVIQFFQSFVFSAAFWFKSESVFLNTNNLVVT